MQQFYKGRTDNHLTWVMVDATDFATPESAMSAATKIKIYGKLRADNTVYFVSSGTGSLTNDIKHVGASVLGIYTIGLVKADLSDASAAWYDQYVISLSATGAAYQTLVVDGGIDASAILAFSDMISNAYSAAVVGASRALVAQSTASEAQSHATLAASRILLVQSRLSDFQSAVYASDMSEVLSVLAVLQSGISDIDSDLRSDLKSYLAVMSDVESNILSYLVLLSDAISDVKSAALATNPTASDIASVVWTNTPGAAAASRILRILSDVSQIDSYLIAMSDVLSNAYSAAAVGSSRTLLVQSRLSDFTSAVYPSDISAINAQLTYLSGVVSDLESRVTKAVATSSQAIALQSDLKSAIADVTVSLDAGDISSIASEVASAVIAAGTLTSSDIASHLWTTNTTGAAVASRVLRILSDTSQINSYVIGMSGMLSDVQSAVAVGNSRVLVAKSGVSDIYALLSDVASDVTVMSGVLSDVQSSATAIKAKTDGLTFTVANVVDANIQRVNDVTIVGDGSGTPWGP